MTNKTAVLKTEQDFTYSIGSAFYVPPVTDGLIGAYAFGQNDNYCRTNLGGSGGDAAKIGTLVHSEWYSTLGPSGYLDTQAPETASFTYFAVVKRTNVGAFIMGTIDGNLTSPFAGLYINTSATKKFQGRMTWTNDGGSTWTSYASPQSANPAYDAAAPEWIAVALTCNEAANQIRLYLPREGEVSSYLLAVGTRKVSALNVTIGSAAAPTTAFSNAIPMAGAEFFDRALSAPEVYAVWQARKAFHGQRSIDI